MNKKALWIRFTIGFLLIGWGITLYSGNPIVIRAMLIMSFGLGGGTHFWLRSQTSKISDKLALGCAVFLFFFGFASLSLLFL